MSADNFQLLLEINRAENKLRILRAALFNQHETGEFRAVIGEAPIPQEDIDTEEFEPVEADDANA
jgi:hypothetical protein